MMELNSSAEKGDKQRFTGEDRVRRSVSQGISPAMTVFVTPKEMEKNFGFGSSFIERVLHGTQLLSSVFRVKSNFLTSHFVP